MYVNGRTAGPPENTMFQPSTMGGVMKMNKKLKQYKLQFFVRSISTRPHKHQAHSESQLMYGNKLPYLQSQTEEIEVEL